MRLRNEGFTLIELMAVIVILGLLVTVLTRVIIGQVDKARYTAARTLVAEMHDAVQRFYMDQGRYPASLEELVKKPSDAKLWPQEGYLNGRKEVPKDPWGNDIEYKVPGPEGHPYVIICYGKDKKEGGEGYDKDITCWDL